MNRDEIINLVFEHLKGIDIRVCTEEDAAKLLTVFETIISATTEATAECILKIINAAIEKREYQLKEPSLS